MMERSCEKGHNSQRKETKRWTAERRKRRRRPRWPRTLTPLCEAETLSQLRRLIGKIDSLQMMTCGIGLLALSVDLPGDVHRGLSIHLFVVPPRRWCIEKCAAFAAVDAKRRYALRY
jgi:hypothetical protein